MSDTSQERIEKDLTARGLAATTGYAVLSGFFGTYVGVAADTRLTWGATPSPCLAHGGPRLPTQGPMTWVPCSVAPLPLPGWGWSLSRSCSSSWC